MKLYLLSIFSLLILSGCTNSNYTQTDLEYFYFDTPITITIYETNKDTFDIFKIKEDVDQILLDIENMFSTEIETSEISKLNQDKTIIASDEFLKVFTTANNYCLNVSDVYDPTSGSLIELWSINNDNYLPTENEITNALVGVDCSLNQIEGSNITISDSSLVDLGSIVKGYAADVIETYLLDNGVTSALINLGGNIQTIGTKPDGSHFSIGVMRPEIDNISSENVLVLDINNKSVVTSGINQRFFEKDGVIYHHIINANTGVPEQNNLASVTIINESGINADALSTICFLLGVEDGLKYINRLENTEAIFITKDHMIYMSDGIDNYELVDDSYTIK